MTRSLVLAVTLAACVGEVPEGPEVTEAGDTEGRPRGIYLVTPKVGAPSPEEDLMFAGGPPARRIIFLNRNGGTYKPGADDSSTNRSSIPGFNATVPAYEGSNADWNQFMTCIRDQFARFNVEVTDVDPGSTTHIEAVMGGSPGNIGMGSGVGGVAPMFGDCSVVERAVVYIFTKVFSSPQVECEVAAQEIGHALGMDHEYLCADPMTYLSGCGQKTFQDIDAQCGEYSPRTCTCGGSRQNSVQFLFGRLGESDIAPPPPEDPSDPTDPTDPTDPPDSDTVKPTVAIVSPAAGATLPANGTITVSATASDDRSLAKVDLIWQYSSTVTMSCDAPPQGVTCSGSGGTYTWSIKVGSGARTFSVRATDAAGNTATTEARSITLGGDGGGGTPPPPTGGSPSVTVTSPAGGTTIAPGEWMDIRATATDDGSVKQVWLFWIMPSGTYYPYALSRGSGDEWTLDLQLSPYAAAGTRTLRIAAYDNQGNRTNAPDVVLTVTP